MRRLQGRQDHAPRPDRPTEVGPARTWALATTRGSCSALIAAIGGSFAPRPAGAKAPRVSLRAEIAEGLRWLLGHRLLRTLAVMVGLMNLATMAGEAIGVLFVQEKLGLGSVGYGLLWSAPTGWWARGPSQ